MRFGERRQLIVICHIQGIKRASIDAQAAKNTFSIIYLRHYRFFILLPLLIYLYHSNCLCYSFASNSAKLTSSTFIMKQNMSTSSPSNSNSFFGVKLVSITYKFQLFLWITEC